MATQSVKIPVELEVQMREMGSQIDKIRQLMGKIDPNTKGFQRLETQLKGIEREFQNIKKRAGETFTTQGQINTFSRKFEHLQTMTEDFGDSLKKIKFTAFKDDVFDQGILDNIKNTKDEIGNLEKEMAKLGGEAFVKTAKASQDLVDTLKELGVHSVDELVDEKKAVDSFNKIKESSKALKKELGDLDAKKNSKTNQKDREALTLDKKDFDLTTATQEYQKLQAATEAARKELEAFQKVQQSTSTQAKRKSLNDAEAALNKLGVEKANFKTKAGRAQNGKDYFGDKGDKLDKDKLLKHLMDDLSFTQEDLDRAGALSLTEQSLDAFYKNLAEILKEKKESFEQEIAKIDKDVSDADAALKKAEGAESTGKDKVDAAQAQFNKQKQIVDSLSKEITDLEKRANEVQAKIDRNAAATAALEQAGKDRGQALEVAPQIQQIKKLEQRVRILEEELRKSSPTGQELQKNLEGVGKGAQNAQGPVDGMRNKLTQLNEASRRLNGIQDAIKRWFGFNEVINLTKRAISDAINHIRELDKVMTEIAVVTDMTQKELWDQIETYSAMAQKYGATTEGVYEVSQLYYQQGLQTADVMRLTEETLKMAKIANIDYADATDYMTVAIRGFKMEMSDAQNVVDVYSNIAAITASDTEELAVAMSKTASSAEAVGSSFENTTAMIALMVETTREAPENIGSAMKSIISRYGEMTTNPAKLVDSEGEAMSLNKVDKALASVGITLQDVNGQFRDFDEVILELSSKWDTIDKNTQRYIATVMAGNRQQSRFLALVGNYDRLSELYEEAADSQDAATLQTLKTMDSIETKINQLKVAFQEFYTNTGIEELIKGVLEYVTSIINTFNNMPKLFDTIPVYALTVLARLIVGIKSFSLKILGTINDIVSKIGQTISTAIKNNTPEMNEQMRRSGQEGGKAYQEGVQQGIKGNKIDPSKGVQDSKKGKSSKGLSTALTAVSAIGTAMTMVGLSIDENNRKTKAWVTTLGSVASNVGSMAGLGAQIGGGWGALIGGIVGVIASIPDIIVGIETATEDVEEKIERLTKDVEDSNNEALLSKNELKTLTDYKKKYEQLAKSQYRSIEAKQNFINLQNEIAEKYPELISSIDSEGNYIVNLTKAYDNLAAAKGNAYRTDFLEKGIAQLAAFSDIDVILESIGLSSGQHNFTPIQGNSGGAKVITKILESIASGENVDTSVALGIDQATYSNTGYQDLMQWFPETMHNVVGRVDRFDRENTTRIFSSKRASLGTDTTAWQGWGINAAEDFMVDIVSKIVEENFTYEEINDYLTEVYSITGEEIILSKDVYDAFHQFGTTAEYTSTLTNKTIESLNIQARDAYAFILGIEEDSQIILDQLDKNIASEWESFQLEHADMEISEAWGLFYTTEMPAIIEGFFDSEQNIFKGLSEQTQSDLDNIYGNLSTYSYLHRGAGDQELVQVLNSIGIYDQEIIDVVISKWKEETLELRNDFINGVKLLKTDSQGNIIPTDFLTEIAGSIPPYLLSLIYGQFEYAARNIETDFDGTKDAFDALGAFYTEMIIPLGAEAERIAANADLTSLVGIEAMLTEMEAAGIDTSGLDMSRWINTLTVNLDLEWETYSNKIAEGMKSFEEAIANASEGMDLEEAIAMANKLGVTLDDFRFEDGKYFFDDIELVIQEYRDYSERLRENIQTETDNIRQNLSQKADQWVTFSDGEFTFAEEVDAEFQAFVSSRADEYAAWLEENGKMHSSQNLTKFLTGELDELDDNTVQMIEEYEKRLTAMAYLSVENLAKFFETLGLTAEEQAQILEALKTGDTSNLTGNALKVYYEYEDELTSLITSTISDMTDAALEAISSGKTQRVDITNLEKYNSELAKDIKNGALKGITYQETDSQAFALIDPKISKETYKSFLDAMNYTTEQYNDAMVDYFDATTKDIEGALDGILSDTKKIDYSSITEFATALGYTIDDLLEKGIFTLNPDKLTYRVQDFGKLEQEVQSKVTYAQEMIRDSISDYLDEILGYVSNGISGSMSNVEFAQLQDFIHNYDADLNLQFTETAEGLKLTQGSVLQVYSTLKDVDNLAAQVILDELVESAMDSDERLNNIYNVMSDIADLNKQIANADPGSARYKALQEELKLAEGIRDTLMEAGDAFNFMEQDLPTSLTNPLSMREGISDALNILDGTEFKDGQGYIDFTAFYNMINMMDQAGVDLSNMATGFNEKADLATELIKAAAHNLTTVDGETVIDLSGLGTQFNLSTKDMRNGLAKGIQTIAESQIDMIDAEIALLETIVASQSAFDQVASEDNIIDVKDFMPTFNASENAYQWSESQLTVLKEVARYLPGLVLDGVHTIEQLLSDPNLWIGLSQSEQTLVANLAQALHEVFDGNDWNSLLNDNNIKLIENKLNSVLAAYGKQVTVNTSKLTETINFKSGSTQDITNGLVAAIGETNWNALGETYREKLVSLVKTAIDNGETFSLVDIFQTDELPNDLKEALFQALGLAFGQISEIKMPEDLEAITVSGEGEVNTELRWSESTQTAWYNNKKLGTFASKEQAEKAFSEHLNLSNALAKNHYSLSSTTEVEENTKLSYSIIYDESGKTVGYQYKGINYSDWVKMYEQMQKDLTPELPSDTIDETTITTTNKIILSSDNLVLETTSEGEQVTLKPIASAKVPINELILIPSQNGIKLDESAEENKHIIDSAEVDVTTLTITPITTQFPAEHIISFETADGTIKSLTVTAINYTPTIGEEAVQTNAATLSVDATAANGIVNLQSYKVSTLDSAGNVVDTITVNGTAELTATILGLSQGITGGYIIDGISGDAIINADPANAELALNTLFTTWNNKEILFNVVTSYTPSSGVDLSAADKQKVAGLADNTSTLDSAVTTFIGNKDKFILAYNAIKTAVENGIPISQEDINLLNGMSEAIEAMGESSLDSFAKELGQTASSAEQLSNVSTSVVNTATTLSNLNLAQTAMFLAEMASNGQILISLDFSNFGGLEGTVEFISSQIQAIVDDINGLDGTTKTVYINEIRNSSGGGGDISTTTTSNFNVNINSDAAQAQLNALSGIVTRLGAITSVTSGTINSFIQKLVTLRNAINSLPDKSRAVSNTANAMNKLKSKNVAVNVSSSIKTTATVTVKIRASTSQKNVSATVIGGNQTVTKREEKNTDGTKGSKDSSAKGNVALVKGSSKGSAKAAGTRRTLMGELGPELVVSKGHYYVVGQNGAEFVDLADDAIVFNHLQTKKLLGAGGSVGTGEPVTNERNAVALASGNTSGPAMASAADALNELYKLRAMWQGLLDASAKELGQKAGLGSGKGSGGGGGGGGSGEDTKAYLHDLERWYNLLRQIEKLEQQITYEQAKRENMRNGYKYSESLQKELELLRKQKAAHEELAKLQKSYYEARRKDLESTDYAKIFTYDEDGLMQYVNGKNRGLDVLATLNETDANGKAKRDAKQQLAYLKSIGFNISVLKTNADGSKAETEEDQVQNFWDGIDGWMEEMDSLYDSYNEAATATEEATQKMNEILQEYIDNQLEVEQKLLKAIEDREQAEIDRIQDEKDALEEAAQEYIDGLNDALSKEREMYDKNETEAETARLQRRLAILQRSGGSTSEIKALQDQIDSRLKDAYFQEQQDQIDAIQEASDNQIEKLQEQIDIMTETLEYQKENGLLWQEVYQMINNWTPEAMLQFIEQYTQEYQQNSALQNQQDSEETLQQLQMLDDDRARKERESAWTEYYTGLKDYSDDVKEKHKEGARAAFEEAYKKEGESAAIAAANKYYETATKTSTSQDSIQPEEETETSPDTEKITGKGTVKTKGSNLNVRSGPGTSYQKIGKLKNKSSVTLTGYKNKWYQIDYNGETGYVHGDYIKTDDKKKLPAFKSGGLVDFTGPAWVDGSKSKPEAFLSAEDTAMLKSKIFSNSDGSLKALVAALEAITSDTSKFSGVAETSNSIVIQNVQVNIQPGTISNDYDARRAGEMALEEMVKIARKTTNRVVSR